MMSEKRFIRNMVGDIYDSEKDKWFEEDWKGKSLGYDDDLIVFLNEQQATIKSKDKQLERLYNYFQDYLKDEMSGNAFSEMWDNVKEDERWNDE